MKHFFELESENGLTRDKADKLREFYRRVPVNGNIGNVTLHKLLEITETEYRNLHQILYDGGKIGKARGKGGSVNRPPLAGDADLEVGGPMPAALSGRPNRPSMH